MSALHFLPGTLTLDIIQKSVEQPLKIQLDKSCWSAIKRSSDFIQTAIENNEVIYGINTGFGLLANTPISTKDLASLQKRILLSHAAGVGELLSDEIVRLILLLKINALAQGFSGVRPIIIETLITFFNKGIYPCIPSKGSVGASGDLAPLSHLCLPLIGEGTVRVQGKIISGKEALALISQPALELGPKEGLALINGTQVSTAIALYHLLQAQDLLAATIAISALTVDAAAGSDTAFTPAIHIIRNQSGQIEIARQLQEYLADSEIRHSHLNCTRVQDPYCLRCIPQVVGASLDNFKHVQNILVREANAVTDNPLIFAEEGKIYSGGNFHAEYVAQAADLLAIALSELGALSERRIALLVDPHFNGGLSAFLTPNPGLNSGFMIAHVTAAALASANKTFAHPASIDSLPTSANQEDHVSMATFAAYRLKDIIDNVSHIFSIELLAACQGIDLRHPLKTSVKLNEIHALVRAQILFWDEDRYFAEDINKAKPLVFQIGKNSRECTFGGTTTFPKMELSEENAADTFIL
ncbi:MAG: histidine ammonia-lyase [Legionella sp.]|nr:histidine ammonia-lyase [Legionella sp.]